MIVHMIGNAHIDPVWLWPWQAGVDEALATFISAADRCDEYPEFIFTRGEAWLYQQIERLQPQLFERVRRLVERGQWHITGGQYLQPDINLPTEQGLRRQLIHGQRYFREKFGIVTSIGWNVDSFGHTATLPDILADHGYAAYVFRRPQEHQVSLPTQAFIWRGANGGEVLAFRITPGYVANFDDLYGQIMIAAEDADGSLGHTMCFYGIGNHGGGPSRRMIEFILENRSSFQGLELRFSTPQAYFDAIAPQRDRLPVVTTELQRTFPGCYSVMHDIKSEQRHAEQLLDQTERAIRCFAADEAERTRESAKLDRAWEDLLFTQFHDILAGTSVPTAWRSVRAMQGRARIAAEEILFDVTRRWSYRVLPRVNEHQIVAINTDEAPFEGLLPAEPYLDFDNWRQRWLSDLDGNPVPFQQVQPSAQQLVPAILFPASIPAGGSAQLLVRNDRRPADLRFATDIEAVAGRLANGRLDVRLGTGGIAGISFDGQPLLGTLGLGLHLRRDSTDTWAFHTDRWGEPIVATFAAADWVLEETGPLRARARLDGRLGNSRLRLTVALPNAAPRLQLRLEVNFDESFTLLQMPIHLRVAPERWSDGIAAGVVSREASPTEWPVQGWSRVRVRGIDVALVTNDAFSLSLDGAIWQWTLLRSPKMAWGGGTPEIHYGHDTFTDQGTHVFDFEMRFGAALAPEELHRAARLQAQPPIVFDRYEGMNRPSWGGVPPRGLWGPAIERNIADGRLAPPPDDGADRAGGLFRRADHLDHG